MPSYCILRWVILQHHVTIYTELLAALVAFPKALTQSNECVIFLWRRLDILLFFFPLNSQQGVLWCKPQLHSMFSLMTCCKIVISGCSPKFFFYTLILVGSQKIQGQPGYGAPSTLAPVFIEPTGAKIT